MRSRQLTLIAIILFVCVCSIPIKAIASILDVKEQNGIIYLLFDVPFKIERYDALNETWLQPIPLAGIPSSFDVGPDTIYVGLWDSIFKMGLDGSAPQIMTTITGYAEHLSILNDHLVFVNSESKITSINRTTGIISAVSPSYTPYQGISVSPSRNRIYARSIGRSPADIYIVEMTTSGTFGTRYDDMVFDSPYHGDYPSATDTFVVPQEDLVIDNSGTVYHADDLTWANSMAGAFDYISFHGNNPVVLRGSTLYLYTNEFVETGQHTFTETPAGISVVNDNIFVLFESANSHGTDVSKLPASQIAPIGPVPPINPVNLNYTPDEIEIGSDGTLYLLSIEHKQVFRWSLSERKYLDSIPLLGTPSHMTYASVGNRIYVSYDTGKITYIDLDQTDIEKQFRNMSWKPLGIKAFENFLFVCDFTGPWESHFTFDSDGNFISQEDWNYPSKEFIWSPVNGKMYFFRDGTSPNDLLWEEIDSNGVIGQKKDSPYHNSAGIKFPIRVAPDGSVVLLGSGNIYNAQTLELLLTLPNEIVDAVWLNGAAYSFNYELGPARLQKWNNAYTQADSVTFTGSPIRLFEYNNELIGVVAYKGQPSIIIWNAQLQEQYSNIPDFLAEKTGVQVGNTFTYQANVSGYPPTDYTTTYTGIDTSKLPGESAYVAESVSGTASEKSWQTVDNNEVRVRVLQLLLNNVLQAEFKITPGQIFYWIPNTVGESRGDTSNLVIDGADAGWAQYTATVESQETVSLPFGDVPAFKIQFRFQTGEQPEFDIWVVPYIGVVKYDDGELTEILTDFTIAGGQVTLTGDTDGDLLKDWEELVLYQTKAKKADSDGDGLNDFVEINGFGTDPNDPDTDNDGINDNSESTYSTDPLDADSDDDGLSDGDEVMTHGTDPLNLDSDGDGLEDGDEVNRGTNPLDEDTDNDLMPDDWEVAYGLDPLVDDAALDYDGDTVSNYDEFVAGRHPANKEPQPPVLNLPGNGDTAQPVTLTLYTEPMLDADGDTHTQTRWQISTEEAATFADGLVLDFKTTADLISTDIPALVLKPNSVYYWRVKYTDSRDGTSDWSAVFSFETETAGGEDADSNGVPDDQQINSATLDLDQDGVPDMTQPNMRCLHAQKGNMDVGLKAGAKVNAIENLSWIDPATIADQTNRPADLSIGLLNFKVQTAAVGGQVTLTVHLSAPAPPNARWYKYSPANGWQDFSAFAAFSPDRKSVTLTLTDGGAGDLDGVANRIIIDPSGLGSGGSSPPAAVAGLSGGGGGGGGCFIATAAFGSQYEKHVSILRQFRDRFMLPTRIGTYLTHQYYKYSPPVAEWVKTNETGQKAIKWLLVPVAGISWLCLQLGGSFSILVLILFICGWANVYARCKKPLRQL